MAAYTCSFSRGAFAPAHNKRLKTAMYGKDNFDPSRSNQNIILVDHDIEKLYDVLFLDGWNEFNEIQRHGRLKGLDENGNEIRTKAHPERVKKEKYIDELRHPNSASKGAIAVEYVGQWGNSVIHPTEEEVEEMSRKFRTRFEERYGSNLKIVQFIIHKDESGDKSNLESVKGTTHFHISFIPIRHSKTGMPLQYGFTGARRELGFGKDRIDPTTGKITKPSGHSTFIEFEHEILDLMDEILKEYGHQREIVGNDRSHLDPGLFRDLAESYEENAKREAQKVYSEILAQEQQRVEELRSDAATITNQITDKLADNQLQIQQSINSINDALAQFKGSDVSELDFENIPKSPEDLLNQLDEIRHLEGVLLGEETDLEIPRVKWHGTVGYFIPETKGKLLGNFLRTLTAILRPFWIHLTQIAKSLQALFRKKKILASKAVTQEDLEFYKKYKDDRGQIFYDFPNSEQALNRLQDIENKLKITAGISPKSAPVLTEELEKY